MLLLGGLGNDVFGGLRGPVASSPCHFSPALPCGALLDALSLFGALCVTMV